MPVVPSIPYDHVRADPQVDIDGAKAFEAKFSEFAGTK